MLSESHPLIRRLIRFALLPHCYLRLVNWRECTRSRIGVALDFLYIFFVLRDFPDNYGPCRLWELPRTDWARFFGSNYNPYQKSLLRREVNPLDIQIVFNDKHVCDLLCRGLGVPLPELVGVLEPSRDIEAALREMFESARVSRLMIKPVHGHAGIGVHMAIDHPDGIVLKGSRNSFPVREWKVPEKCIVQRVVPQEPKVARIAPESLNTIRILTMLSRDGKAFIVGASMRFGVGEAVIDNWSAGGIAVGVNHREGTLKEFAFDKTGRRYESHPVSGVRFQGQSIPRWDEAIALALGVQVGCPFNRLLGLDVAITPTGVVLIEINPDADLVFQEQTSGPLFASRRTWEAFKQYGLLYNRPQRRLFR